MKRTFILLFLCISLLTLADNKTHTICGEYIYYAPVNVTIEEAKRIAIERAKLSALADKFGTMVSQNNITVVSNGNEQSNVDFKSLSASEVKGEWIEDAEVPETKISYEKDMLIVKANVCGKAREITHAAINFSTKILCNGKEDKFESTNFKEGDDLYLSFQSPVNGFLAVYLIDDNEQTAFCLLPYARDNNGQVQIKHGQRYVFFDSKSVPEKDKNTVDELTMTCTKSIEHNQLYIIFSPYTFTKANDNLKNEFLPRELSFSDFQRWIIKNRNVDKAMQMEVKVIQISKQ